MSACERIGLLLDGYHDGELGWLRRARVRRHLAGCPACRDVLGELEGVGHWVRAAAGAPPDPDLWREIQLQLPAERTAEAARRTTSRPVRRWPAFAMPMLGAGAAAAVVALVVTGGPEWPRSLLPAAQTVVRSVNAHGRPFMVLEAPDDATIIWLLDEEGVPGSEETNVWI